MLEQLAREILSIPASSSLSERTFSVRTRACSAKRHNLSPKRISDLMILNVNEDDVEHYREKYGIKNLFKGDILKLVDVEFVTEAEETLPPPHYDLEDEFFDERRRVILRTGNPIQMKTLMMTAKMSKNLIS